MVGPVPAKVRKTAIRKEEGACFAITPKNLPSLDAEFSGVCYCHQSWSNSMIWRYRAGFKFQAVILE